MPNVDSVFEQVRDLAAVRIATYERNDEDNVSLLFVVDLSGNSGPR